MRFSSIHLCSVPAASLIALTALGCGGGGSSVAVDDLPDGYATAACTQLDRCLGPLSDLFFGSDCTDTFSIQLQETLLPLWRAGIDAGTIEYDPSAAADCLNELQDMACDATGPRGTRCDDVFRGTVAEGGACSTHEECAGDAFCDVEASCPGQCRPRGAAGASCREDEECVAGLQCLDEECGVPLPLGSSCEDDNDCAGLSTCLAGRCATIPESLTAAIGESCDPETGMLCEVGASCVLEGFDATTNTAQWRCAGPSSSGGACKLGLPDPCPSGEYCDADPATTLMFDGTCQPLPGAGQPCREGGEFVGRRCDEGLVCSDGVCSGMQHLGASCNSDRECYSDSCESGVCAAPRCYSTP